MTAPSPQRPPVGAPDDVRDVEGAGRALVVDLRGRLGLDLWLVERVDGPGHRVVAAADGSGALDLVRLADDPRVDDARVVVDVSIPAAGGGSLGRVRGLGDPADLVITAGAARSTVTVTAAVLGALISHEIALGQYERRLVRAEAAAGTDVLTGLGNRRRWTAALTVEETRANRRGSTAGVLVIDLDGLKEVNDTEGHLAGDELLRRAAHVLGEGCRVADLVVRLGGDEFGVLLPEADDAGLVEVTARIEGALAEAGISASLGGALRRAGSTLSTTWEEADAAMYDAKVRRRRMRLRLVEDELPAPG